MSEATSGKKCGSKAVTWKQFVTNIIFILAMIPIGIVGICELSETSRHEEEVRLKRDLAHRGMSADDILKVVNGSRSRYYTSSYESRSRTSYYDREQAKLESELYRYLREEGFSTRDIVRLMDVTWGEEKPRVRTSSALRRSKNAMATTKALVQRGLGVAEIERALGRSGQNHKAGAVHSPLDDDIKRTIETRKEPRTEKKEPAPSRSR